MFDVQRKAGAAGGGAVVKPSPTFSGSLRDITNATSFALTPTRTCTGKALLWVALTDGQTITTPGVVTGGGVGAAVTWKWIPPVGNEDALGGSTRKIFAYQGTGTFNGSAITFTPTDGATGECTMHLIDWADTAPTGDPFICNVFTPLAGSNSTFHDEYQMDRLSPNNVLTGFAFNGNADNPHTLSEGTVIRHDQAPGFILSVTSWWLNTDLSVQGPFQFRLSGYTSSSCGGFILQVRASDSPAGPTAATPRGMLDWTDNAANIDTAAYTAKANEVVLFSAITEKAGDVTDFLTCADAAGAGNAFTKILKVNLDADHALHLYAFRYGASPPVGTTLRATHTGSLTGSVGELTGFLKADGTALPGSTNTDWIVQSGSRASAASTSIDPAGGLTGVVATSGVLAVFAGDLATADFVFKQGWVPIVKGRDSTFGNGFETETILILWHAGNVDMSPSASCSVRDLALAWLEVA